jgi:hypothetical protein
MGMGYLVEEPSLNCADSVDRRVFDTNDTHASKRSAGIVRRQGWETTLTAATFEGKLPNGSVLNALLRPSPGACVRDRIGQRIHSRPDVPFEGQFLAIVAGRSAVAEYGCLLAHMDLDRVVALI